MYQIRDFTQQRFYKVFRNEASARKCYAIEGNYSIQKKVALNFKQMCEIETPIVFPKERITFTRTNRMIPPAFSSEDLEREYDTHHKFYNMINNVCPDYAIILREGLSGLRKKIKKEELKCRSHEEKDFFESCEIVIDAIYELVYRYRKEAEKVGNMTVSEILSRVPEESCTSFIDALQTLRLVSSLFYLCGNYQLGFGRIDQYLYPYYLYEKKHGASDEDILDMIEEFFVSLNRDTDLYFGVQQGDNGQSMMLGGVTRSGESGINELTYLFLKASKSLKLIDPKINLRIDRNTPDDLLILGCELTKEGLGFPQYSNDEVVIPALVKAGYDLEDARDYTVAACWEFIIPGYGLDIVNQGAVSFPYAVDSAISIADVGKISISEYESRVKKSIQKQANNILKNRNQYLLPSPLVSLLFHGSIEKHMDITKCAKYRNRGIHGAGSANAADAMYIIEYLLMHDKEKLVQYLYSKEKNFEGDEELIKKIHDNYPKVGNADKNVDELLGKLFSCFADVCEDLSSESCHVRPGTGSAQFYVWLAERKNDWIVEPIVGATLDGRREGEPLSSSLAPASGVKVEGLISVLRSFSHIDYSRCMNGGPITVELSPSVFGTKEGITKLKDIIKFFVMLGNQQLQLNVLDERILEDAIKHPEKHKNLIVRVWGWSGYFCELAPEFQRQILNRHKYGI